MSSTNLFDEKSVASAGGMVEESNLTSYSATFLDSSLYAAADRYPELPVAWNVGKIRTEELKNRVPETTSSYYLRPGDQSNLVGLYGDDPGKAWEAPAKRYDRKNGSDEVKTVEDFLQPDIRWSLLETAHVLELTTVAARVLCAGAVDQFQNKIAEAFKTFDGCENKFDNFMDELREQLAKQKIQLNFRKRTFTVHRDESPYGIEFDIDANLDFRSGDLIPRLTNQVYDWNSKKNVGNVRAADVMRNKSNK